MQQVHLFNQLAVEFKAEVLLVEINNQKSVLGCAGLDMCI